MIPPEAIALEKALGGPIGNIQSENFIALVGHKASCFLDQGMGPILGHANKVLEGDQAAGMPLRILRNGLVPLTLHQTFPTLLAEPLKRPLLVAAEVVAAYHDAS